MCRRSCSTRLSLPPPAHSSARSSRAPGATGGGGSQWMKGHRWPLRPRKSRRCCCSSSGSSLTRRRRSEKHFVNLLSCCWKGELICVPLLLSLSSLSLSTSLLCPAAASGGPAGGRCDVSSVPRVGPSLQKPFSQYLEAQRNKLHHAGGSAPAVGSFLSYSLSFTMAPLADSLPDCYRPPFVSRHSRTFFSL